MLEGVWEVLPIIFLPVDGTVTRPSQREEELPFSCYFFFKGFGLSSHHYKLVACLTLSLLQLEWQHLHVGTPWQPAGNFSLKD